MPTEVELTPAIKTMLLVCAHRRQREKVSETSRKRDNGWTDLALHFLGLKGEYCAKVSLGLPFSDTAYGARGDNGIDLVARGYSWAIKARHLRHGDHVVERKSDLSKVTRVLFVQGPCLKGHCLCRRLDVTSPETWVCKGWLPVDEFWSVCHEDDWGYGPRWWVSDGQLHQEDV